MIIGLTGPNASGKGEAANYLKSKGFIYYSLSDILREKCSKLGIKPLREDLIKMGNRLRREKGAPVLALKIIEKLQEAKNYVIDSIRNPEEVKAFRKLDGFLLLGIDAPTELRFKRSLKRKRAGDAGNLKDFIEKEEKENRDDIESQQLKKCLQFSDIRIINDSTIERFHKKINGAIKLYEKA